MLDKQDFKKIHDYLLSDDFSAGQPPVKVESDPTPGFYWLGLILRSTSIDFKASGKSNLGLSH